MILYSTVRYITPLYVCHIKQYYVIKFTEYGLLWFIQFHKTDNTNRKMSHLLLVNNHITTINAIKMLYQNDKYK